MDFTMCLYFCMKMEDCNAFRITDENICITYNLTDTNIASCLKVSDNFVELWIIRLKFWPLPSCLIHATFEHQTFEFPKETCFEVKYFPSLLLRNGMCMMEAPSEVHT